MAVKDTIIKLLPKKLPKFTFFRCVLYFILLCIFPPTRAIIVDVLFWAIKQWAYYVILPIGQWSLEYFLKSHRTSIIDSLVTNMHTSITQYRDDALRDQLLNFEDNLMEHLNIPVEFAKRLNIVLEAMTDEKGYNQLVVAKDQFATEIDNVMRSAVTSVDNIPKDLRGGKILQCKSYLYETVDYVRRSLFTKLMRNNFGLVSKLEGHFLHSVSVKKNIKVLDDIYGKGQISNAEIIASMVDTSKYTTQAMKELVLDISDAMGNFVTCMGNKRLPPLVAEKPKYKV